MKTFRQADFPVSEIRRFREPRAGVSVYCPFSHSLRSGSAIYRYFSNSALVLRIPSSSGCVLPSNSMPI